MPELPEVEIVKRQLSLNIINNKIKNISTSELKLHGKEIPNLNALIGESFSHIHRRNKYLILESDNHYLIIHLGMTGQLIQTPNLPEIKKHIHMIIYFQNLILYYKDVRRFGKIELYSKDNYPNYLEIPFIKKLGFEPLDDNFNILALNNLIKDNSSNAKKFIMDGNKICGIGNIYANEILFLSKINPESSIKNINKKQKNLLFNNIKTVLQQAIDLGGSTISDFVHLNGNKGTMQDHYYVYGREGQPCKECGTSIKKITQNGRSTFYCPNCQK